MKKTYFLLILAISFGQIIGASSLGLNNGIFLSQVNLEPVVFTYNKIDMVALEGKSVIDKNTKLINGRIEFYKDIIKSVIGNSDEKFFILKVIKETGGYQIRATTNKGDNCVISIVNQRGIDFVTIHFIDLEMLAMFHITNGFSTDIKIYE